MAASFVGLKPVIDMWKAAQEQRKKATPAIELEPSSSSSAMAGDGVAAPPQMSSHASAQVRSALMDLETSRYEVTAKLDDGESVCEAVADVLLRLAHSPLLPAALPPRSRREALGRE